KRVSIFIDGQDYFHNLYENISRIKTSAYFIGWDFDSRLELRRIHHENESLPSTFGALLKSLTRKRPHLDIKIVAWDFATFYLPMRELFQKAKFQRLGSNIRFAF